MIDWSNVSGELIVSICAVVVSVISLVFSIVFSRLQIRHNINSVRPISDIVTMDYEDLLSVKIENVGTGPLTIDLITVVLDDQEAKDLISLMPDVDQAWSTFAMDIERRTVPVGGSVVLVEIDPKSQINRRKVRQALSQATIELCYSDIYGNKYYDVKNLETFKRNL